MPGIFFARTPRGGLPDLLPSSLFHGFSTAHRFH
jgi:hypothetical protein